MTAISSGVFFKDIFSVLKYLRYELMPFVSLQIISVYLNKENNTTGENMCGYGHFNTVISPSNILFVSFITDHQQTKNFGFVLEYRHIKLKGIGLP